MRDPLTPERDIPWRPAPIKAPEIKDRQQIKVRHAHGSLAFTYKSILDACLDATPLTDLAPLDLASDISGAPALQYVTDEVTLALTAQEILSLVFASLSPEAYKALRQKHDLFFEIEEDFYDDETGECLQPFM